MHIHIGVDSLDDSIRFYSALFGAEPVKQKDDYAKWMLDDPCINFAISTQTKTGIDHLGLQVDSEEALAALRERMQGAEMSLFNEGETVCCYARSDKSWAQDPTGIPWETYRHMEDVQRYSGIEEPVAGAEAPATSTGCCSA
jgi:catechol 2,3-dioxygenase-like lactoylglutathione lyase family enzyme